MRCRHSWDGTFGRVCQAVDAQTGSELWTFKGQPMVRPLDRLPTISPDGATVFVLSSNAPTAIDSKKLLPPGP